jgi:hypothetical protein
MAVSRIIPVGGANDFNINVTGVYTTAILDAEKSAGSYAIVSSSNDDTIDIYAFNGAGTAVGYTNNKAFTTSGNFNKLVIIGGTADDVLSFSFKTTYASADETAEVTAGPVATSTTPSSLPNVGDTTVLTGRNFASNATVTISSANTAFASTSATVVRNSATQLTVTRPTVFPVAYSPYTMTVENPGVPNPTATNSHILANSITAGTSPTWGANTYAAFFVTSQAGYSYQLVASDSEGSTITFSQVSGALPAGLTLASTGAITGTPAASATTTTTATFRATDAGGNFVDKTITFPVFTWTQSLSFAGSTPVQLTPTVTTEASLSYSIASGSLPSGLSLASNGLITGAVGASTTGTVNITVADGRGGTNTKSFSWSSRIEAAGTTFNISSLPTFFLANDIITGFSSNGGNFPYASFKNSTSVRLECKGAGGGTASGGLALGAPGGLSIVDMAVSNIGGSGLTYYIGGAGTVSGGSNFGSGGGGYSAFRRAFDNAWIVMAGGGGGSGGQEGQTPGAGGAGGGANQNGNNGASGAGGGGGGGTSSTGGGGGGGSYGSGFSGSSLQGGNGGSNSTSGSLGGVNGGGRGGFGYGGGGGGGGGWYGGGGGGAAPSSSGGGGGGSGYANTSICTVNTATVGGGAGTAQTGSLKMTILAVS